MKLKILLISFIISLPFWLLMNILAYNLEDFYFWNQLAKNPEILTAQASSELQLLKLQKEKEQKKSVEIIIDELSPNTKTVISVEIDKNGNEKILFEKNSKDQLVIASLTKLMTALVIFDLDETYNSSLLVPITKEAVEQEGVSKYGELKEGEFFTVETLLHIMLIESSNDAAYALAEIIGQEGFVDLMNQYARKTGLENSHFVNVTGLDTGNGENNVSTARDIIKLTKYILKNQPKIFEITVNTSYNVFDATDALHHFIPENTNELLGEVERIIGGKTGWSVQANGCLLLVLDNKEDSYIINIILGTDDRFEDMRSLIKLISF